MAKYVAQVILILFLSFGSPGSAKARTDMTHQHAVSSATEVDGSLHPELIPDSMAYRLYLVAVSTAATPTDGEKVRQQAHLSKTGLGSNDRDNLVIIISDFKAKHDDLVQRFNESAKAALAHNEVPDVHTLLQSLDALVQSTRDTLKIRLTPAGLARLHSFVQSEKKNMKITLEN